MFREVSNLLFSYVLYFGYNSAEHFKIHYFALMETFHRGPIYPPLEISRVSLLHFFQTYTDEGEGIQYFIPS